MNYDKDKKQITVSRNTGVTVSLTLLIMFSGALVTATINYNNLGNGVQRNTDAIKKLEMDNSQLSADNVQAKVEFSKIQVQLKSIETNLLEIKERLR